MVLVVLEGDQPGLKGWRGLVDGVSWFAGGQGRPAVFETQLVGSLGDEAGGS